MISAAARIDLLEQPGEKQGEPLLAVRPECGGEGVDLFRRVLDRRALGGKHRHQLGNLPVVLPFKIVDRRAGPHLAGREFGNLALDAGPEPARRCRGETRRDAEQEEGHGKAEGTQGERECGHGLFFLEILSGSSPASVSVCPALGRIT
ncbi:hypothetical protein ACFSKM_14860 [Ancylobacter dichloromethanicus]